MKDKRKAEDIAASRMQLLAPLLEENCDPAKLRALRTQIHAQIGISERTLRRYLAEYRRNGFNGLKPKGKRRETSKVIPSEILEQAVLLRREVPTRSVLQLIQILEWEGLIKPGEIKRSTLQDKLMALGYSTRHMRMYAESGTCICRLSFTPWVGESLQQRRGKLTPVTQRFDIDQGIRQVYALTAFTHAQDRATLRSDLSGVGGLAEGRYTCIVLS